MLTAETLRHLAALVACDTQNPPRDISGDSPVIEHCRDTVGGAFEVEVVDLGDGHVSFYAVRGRPSVLFNVHLDTVPAGTGWSGDPFRLRVEGDRAVGRGACDIKGAAACMLAIAESNPDNMALLFTTDEEGTSGRCVASFCTSGKIEQFNQVVVAEPTGCKAVLGHRGFLAVEGRFRGEPGHSSEARALRDSAIHQLTRWAGAALKLAERQTNSGKGSQGGSATCLNIGTVHGGTANNVIAGEATVQWSARLRPGMSNSEFIDSVVAGAPGGARVEWRVEHDGAPLPAGGQSDDAAREFARGNGLVVAHDVDFWTEASIFSEFGAAALVMGPGRIEQAHITDEWVDLAQLEQACSLYGQIISNDG